MLKPGPGKVFVRPDERHKVRASGITLPTVAQDDAFHGEVIAVGAGGWYGSREGESGLVPEPMRNDLEGWSPVERRMPVAVGDTIFYEVEAVQTFATGFSADSPLYYCLDLRDILGTVERVA
jgi:co-chaperonin GroES (HSP10)